MSGAVVLDWDTEMFMLVGELLIINSCSLAIFENVFSSLFLEAVLLVKKLF